MVKEELTNFNLLMLYAYKTEDIPEEQAEIIRDDFYLLFKELDKIELPKEKVKITLIIDSLGGDAYSAYKMIKLIRSKCEKLTVVIPERAKSAATLMALGADEILMAPESELGPLDLPLGEHPLMEKVKDFSALDGIRPFTLLYDSAKNLAIESLGISLRKKVGLSREDSVNIALKFSKDCIEPIICKLDPWLYSKCYRLLLIAQEYAKELLQNFMFHSDSVEIAEIKSIKTSGELVFGFPEHGYVIDRDCAKDRLKLNIIPLEKFKELHNFCKNIMFNPVDKKIIQITKNLEIK